MKGLQFRIKDNLTDVQVRKAYLENLLQGLVSGNVNFYTVVFIPLELSGEPVMEI